MADVLLLVKHAMPEIIPGQPPRKWKLSEAGRLATARLARDIRRFDPDVVVSSIEPKAAATGEIIAGELRLPFSTHPGLHEHERDNEPFETLDAFHQRVLSFFTNPDAVVYGSESADAARERFTRAVRDVQRLHGDRTLVIVAHGTVMTLLVAAANGIDPYMFWKGLELPSLVAVDPRTFRLVNPAE